MPWPAPLAALAASVTPVDAATGSITGYIVGYGPLGIVALAMAWLFYKGWRLIPPAREDQIRGSARDDGRADLLRENERLVTEKTRAEEHLRAGQDRMITVLTEFDAATAALLPLLRELVSRREGHGR